MKVFPSHHRARWYPTVSWPSWLRGRRTQRVSSAQFETWRSHKRAGEEAYRDGDLVQAEHHFGEALKTAELFGFRDARVAATLNNLALVFKRQSKFGKAEMCFRRALRIYEALRPRHAHVAHVLQNMAGLYSVQGKHKEAEPLRERALAILQNA